MSQLCGLERRVSRAGNSIDHGHGSHDDLANAVAGVCDMVVSGIGSYNLEGLASGRIDDQSACAGEGFTVIGRKISCVRVTHAELARHPTFQTWAQFRRGLTVADRQQSTRQCD